MKKPKYVIELSTETRSELQRFVKSQSRKATDKLKRRASVILHLDINGKKPLTVEQTAQKCKLHPESVYRIRKEFITLGIEHTTTRKKRETPPVEPKITGDVEAHIIAIACSKPPVGKCRWTLQMIADKIVLDGVLDSISDVSVMNTLKKRNINLI